MKILNLFLVSLLLLSSCRSGSNKQDPQELNYYDIKGFFEKEIKKLEKANPTVNKTTIYNKEEEIRSLQIEKWEQELALFSESDINKSSWKGSYKVDSLPNKLIYNAKEEDLRTRKIIIDFKGNTPSRFSIQNKTSNYLYTSIEDLIFYPDSLYIIHKRQNVVLLGTNDYKIVGKLKVKKL